MTAKIKPRLPVVICDPGCRDKRGHHYEFNNFLQEEIEISECLTNIHSLIPEYKQIFYHSPYSMVPPEMKSVYVDQMNEDAKTIANITHGKICILHSVTSQFLEVLTIQPNLDINNLIVLFPAVDDGSINCLKKLKHAWLDEWYRDSKIVGAKYSQFPRLSKWQNQVSGRVIPQTIFFAGAKRAEKRFSDFLNYAGQHNLLAISNESYVDTEKYISQMTTAEFIWLAYEDTFQFKPSNTFLDAIFCKKKIVTRGYLAKKSKELGAKELPEQNSWYQVFDTAFCPTSLGLQNNLDFLLNIKEALRLS